MPKISVNIPCFNSAKFIKETLDSVINQNFSDFEIVIIDDGSTDNTGDIIASVKDPRIKYFYKDNGGLPEARNKGLMASEGEYIAFLDHDDLWLPEKLKEQTDILEKNKNVGIVFSDAYILKNGLREKATYFDRCRPKKGFVFEDLLFESSNFIPLSTVIMRKSVFENTGFFKKEYKLGEDYDFFLRAARKYEFDYVNRPLALYRMHNANFTNHEIFAKETFEILSFWQRKEPGLFNKNEDRFFKKQAAILAELANFYALNSRRKDALRNFNLSIANYRNTKVVMKKYALLILGDYFYRLLYNLKNKPLKNCSHI